MTDPPLPLSFLIHYVPPFYLSSLQPSFTLYQHLPTTWLTPLWHSLSTLPLNTPSLYSLSILLSTIPLYNPFLQLLAPLVTSQPLHMTIPPLMLLLYLLSTSLFYIPFLHPFFNPYIFLSIWLAPLWHSLSILNICPPLYCPALHPLSTIGTAQFLLGFPPVNPRQSQKYHITTFDEIPFDTPSQKFFSSSFLHSQIKMES